MSPDVVLTQEAEVAVVDVEGEVVAVTVEGDDFALGIRRHPLEEDPLVALQGFDALFLSLAGELHLRGGAHGWRQHGGLSSEALQQHITGTSSHQSEVAPVTGDPRSSQTRTDLDGEDGGVPDQEGLDLKGLAEGGSLVHGAHGCGLVGVDVLPQLLPAQRQFLCR